MATTTKKTEPKGVTSHTPPVKDEAMIGFVFPSKFDEGKNPRDFAMDPETGLFMVDGVKVTPSNGGNWLPNNGSDRGKPWGIAQHDLTTGIGGAVLPPLLVWKNGIWLSDIDFGHEPLANLPTKDEFLIWLVSGNGTPGRFWFRAYKMSRRRAEEFAIPKHPILWTKKEKDGTSGNTLGSGVSAKSPWASSMPQTLKVFMGHMELLQKGHVKDEFWDAVKPQPSGVVTTMPPPIGKTTTQAPPLPVGIKFRCPKCGHWFNEQGLKGHATVCPGADSEGFSDWTIMCDDRCGCEVIFGAEPGEKTLDHVSQPKPGFPRPKKEVTVVNETEAPKPDEGDTNPEPSTEEDTSGDS